VRCHPVQPLRSSSPACMTPVYSLLLI
jgi:hypothetical protein